VRKLPASAMVTPGVRLMETGVDLNTPLRQAQPSSTWRCGKTAESAILSENEPDVLRADILKIGHPCSKNSTMPGLLDAVRLAAGCYFRRREKPLRPPRPPLYERLQQGGVPALRTDQKGVVHTFADGNRFEVLALGLIRR